MVQTKKKRAFPFPYLLMLGIMVFIVILSYVVPAGLYERIPNEFTGQAVVDPDSFSYLSEDSVEPISVMDFFASIHDGLISGASIYASLLMLAGALKLVEDSGAMAAGVRKILEKSKGKEFLVVVLLNVVFTALGAIGFGEGGLPFVPITMMVVMALGYDRLAAAATAFLGLSIGWTSGLVNLFSTAVCQRLVGLPIFSGLGMRFVGLVIFWLIGIIYLYWYCRRTKADPSKSYVADEYMSQKVDEDDSALAEMTVARGLSLFLLCVVIFMQAFGALQFGWGLSQIAACYFMLAIALVVINRINPNEACMSFTQGACSMMVIVLMLGFANAVNLLLNQAQIVDTMIHSIAGVLEGKSPVVTLLLMFIIMNVFNFFIVGATGKAVIMMPILSPLGQILGINQQVLTLAFCYGDGITNYIYPTSGGLMAGLALCKLDYRVWFKFFVRLVIIFLFVAFGLIVLANAIGYGPF